MSSAEELSTTHLLYSFQCHNYWLPNTLISRSLSLFVDVDCNSNADEIQINSVSLNRSSRVCCWMSFVSAFCLRLALAKGMLGIVVFNNQFLLPNSISQNFYKSKQCLSLFPSLLFLSVTLCRSITYTEVKCTEDEKYLTAVQSCFSIINVFRLTLFGVVSQ